MNPEEEIVPKPVEPTVIQPNKVPQSSPAENHPAQPIQQEQTVNESVGQSVNQQQNVAFSNQENIKNISKLKKIIIFIVSILFFLIITVVVLSVLFKTQFSPYSYKLPGSETEIYLLFYPDAKLIANEETGFGALANVNMQLEESAKDLRFLSAPIVGAIDPVFTLELTINQVDKENYGVCEDKNNSNLTKIGGRICDYAKTDSGNTYSYLHEFEKDGIYYHAIAQSGFDISNSKINDKDFRDYILDNASSQLNEQDVLEIFDSFSFDLK